MLFGLPAHVEGMTDVPAAVDGRLAAESGRHAQATVSRSLEQNSKHFNDARAKLEKWADDMVLAAEKALKDKRRLAQTGTDRLFTIQWAVA